MTHTYCAFGKCSTCSMLHSLHECEISSKFSNLLHFTNKITHLRIHRTENAMRNYHNYAFSRATRVQIKKIQYFWQIDRQMDEKKHANLGTLRSKFLKILRTIQWDLWKNLGQQTHRHTDRQTDRRVYRVASQLKIK